MIARTAIRFAAMACAAAGLAAAAPALAQDAEPSFADYVAIQDTMHRYTWGLDGHDVDMYLSAWAEDGVFDSGNMQMEGHAAMAELVEGLAATAAERAEAGEPARQLFHTDSNASIEFTAPDRALHKAYFLTLARTGEGAGSEISVVAVGSSVDELHKIDGEWLIVRRTVSNNP